mgnify:CR=1 FL=1
MGAMSSPLSPQVETQLSAALKAHSSKPTDDTAKDLRLAIDAAAQDVLFDLEESSEAPDGGSAWTEGPRASFDLETTGRDPHTARIVTAVPREGESSGRHTPPLRKMARSLTDLARPTLSWAGKQKRLGSPMS